MNAYTEETQRLDIPTTDLDLYNLPASQRSPIVVDFDALGYWVLKLIPFLAVLIVGFILGALWIGWVYVPGGASYIVIGLIVIASVAIALSRRGEGAGDV